MPRAVTPDRGHAGARRQMSLMRDVFPMAFDSRGRHAEDAARGAIAMLREAGLLASGSRVLFTSGDTMEQHGATNTLRVLEA